MGTKRVVLGSLGALLLMFFVVPAPRADTITNSGSVAAKFQNWTTRDLRNNGKPYWDNASLDGKTKRQKNKSNVGFYLTNQTDPSIAPLADGPDDVLPYWGKDVKSKKKTGGSADLSFFFQGTGQSNTASLRLEADSGSNIDEFGWYDIGHPLVLHPIFGGPDSPITNDTFIPSLQYGFYLKRDDQATFYTDSSRNPYKDTAHQHFVVFEESATAGAEVYWIGIENRSRLELRGKEGGLGDYNDMLIRISTPVPPLPVPEPSTVVLVLGGTLLTMVRMRNRRG